VDERVAMAISHWAPRFTMNGVTAGDFERITSGLERWADWCAAWSAVGAEHEELGRDALAAGREMSAGATTSPSSSSSTTSTRCGPRTWLPCGA
jgi:hypothetical protein